MSTILRKYITEPIISHNCRVNRFALKRHISSLPDITYLRVNGIYTSFIFSSSGLIKLRDYDEIFTKRPFRERPSVVLGRGLL